MLRPVIAALTVVLACASVGGTRVTEPFIADLSGFRHLGIQVASENAKFEAEAGALAASLVRKLRPLGWFESVVNLDLFHDRKPDLELLILVRDVNRVGDAVPLIFGPRSQMASLTFRVRLMRMSNRSYLGEAVMDGQYAGDDEFPSTTDEAIRMAVDQIIDYLQSGLRGRKVRPEQGT